LRIELQVEETEEEGREGAIGHSQNRVNETLLGVKRTFMYISRENRALDGGWRSSIP
jgi:hypothetical protein